MVIMNKNELVWSLPRTNEGVGETYIAARGKGVTYLLTDGGSDVWVGVLQGDMYDEVVENGYTAEEVDESPTCEALWGDCLCTMVCDNVAEGKERAQEYDDAL